MLDRVVYAFSFVLFVFLFWLLQVFLGQPLEDLLADIKMSKYREALAKLGFEYSQDLVGLTQADLCTLMATSSPPLPPGHAIRLLNRVPCQPAPQPEETARVVDVTPGAAAPPRGKAFAPPNWKYVHAEVQACLAWQRGLSIAKGGKGSGIKVYLKTVSKPYSSVALNRWVGQTAAQRRYWCCCCFCLLLVRCRIV